MSTGWTRKNYMEISNQLYVGRSSKVGQTSLTNALAPICSRPNVSLKDVAHVKDNPGVEVHAFIRHPFERAESAFHYFNGREAQGFWPQHNGVLTWEQFVDNHLLRGDNHHWAPQARLHTHKGVYVPTTWWRFEDFNTVVPMIFNRPIEHRNPSRKEGRLPVDPNYRRDEFDVFFLEDIGIYYNLAQEIT